MLLLALDTSGSVGAALHGGQRVLAARSEHDPRRHAELLVPMVDEVLREAGAARTDLTHLAVGVGPGPFTGLRVGLVTARTLALALDLPLHGVCSLDALALEVLAAGELATDLLVATDARRKEVYWARYRGGLADGVPVRLSGPAVGRPGDVPVEGAQCVGRGAALYPDELPAGAAPPAGTRSLDTGHLDTGHLDPGAAAVASLCVARLATGGRDLEPAEPMYLRRPDAVEPSARKRVLR